MSKEKRRVPKLRFPGFTEDWEQRKADYIFKSVTDKGYPELPVLSASQELGMVYREQNGIDIQHNKKNEASYKRVLPGQFVIHLRSFQGGFAYSEVEGITSPAYTVMSFKNSTEQYGLFWKHIFKSEIFIKRLETITYGIRDGRSISFSDFKSLILQYPSLSEQKMIGDSIAIIERGITLHQRKLEHLNLKKKALLQKLFPKNGERYPELRFPGFTDAWEQRKLDSLGKIITGNTPSTLKKEYWSPNSDGVVWITPTDINSVKTQCSERLLTKEGAFQARIVPANSILVTCIASIGKNTINTVEAAFNQQINALVPHFSNSYFILTMLNNMESAFKRVAGTSATSIINKKEFGQLSALLPEIEEQNKIGRIFELIDDNITLHQRKLEHLQLQKKALLQQMFV